MLRLPISLYNRPQPYSPFISPPSAPLLRSSISFSSYRSYLLTNESEFFFTPCKLLAYGEMNATLVGGLGNILREDLVCI